MRRLLAIGAALCVAALCMLAAPALSLHPYRPEPVDFSMAVGPAAPSLSGAGQELATSRPMRAPRRFNLVGLSWNSSASEAAHASEEHGAPAATAYVRTRSEGGEWTRWAPLEAQTADGPDPGTGESGGEAVSNPVWMGEGDWVQYRTAERLEDARLRFVNVEGTATAADRARTAVRETASAAVGSVATVLGLGDAAAEDDQPEMVSRAEWGADSCKPRTKAAYGQVKAAYVHHTVNLNDYTSEEAPAIVLAMCRYHRNSNGWNDIGYNFLVDRFGTIYEGRAGGVGAAVVGAQAEGFNSQTTGIANIGTYSDVPQSQEALDAMARLIRWKLPLHGYPTSGTAVLQSAGGASNHYAAGKSVRVKRVLGHRDTNSTACPGNALYAQMPDLRSLIGSAQPQGTGTNLTATLEPRAAVDFGGAVDVAGRLVSLTGAPVSGQKVAVQARVDGRWQTSSFPVTGRDGAFSATVKPRVTRLLRVRFVGAGDLRSSVTPALRMTVRPLVSLRRPARRGRAGSRIRVRGTARPRKARVYQVLQVKRGKRFRKAGVRTVRTQRGGVFDSYFVPAAAGTYRYVVVAKADEETGRGASEKVTIKVVGGATHALRGGARARGSSRPRR